jgi:NADPH:quinone reductase-like Zn-dependent oxidoreductase
MLVGIPTANSGGREQSGAAMSLDGKRVVVIGGASGIGFAIAVLSKEIGAELVIASHK